MHRTEASNNSSNLYSDGPPGTKIIAADLNALQEEICYCIEQSGLTLQTEEADTHQQLKSAIEILSASYGGVPSGTIMWIYADSAPSGWTLDGTPSDELLAIKGGATYTTGGTQAGTWTQPNHTHGVGSYAGPSHTHGPGTYATDTHTHTHSLTTPTHSHTNTFTLKAHGHADTFTVANHNHSLDPSHAVTSGHWHTLTNGDFHSDFSIEADTTRTVTSSGGELRTGIVGAGSTGSYEFQPRVDSETDEVTGRTEDNTAGVSGSVTNYAGGDTLNGGISGGSGTAISGSVDAGASINVTAGVSASDGTGAVTGTSGNGATAATYRPLARVGILCSKD